MLGIEQVGLNHLSNMSRLKELRRSELYVMFVVEKKCGPISITDYTYCYQIERILTIHTQMIVLFYNACGCAVQRPIVHRTSAALCCMGIS